jgi:SPP1 family predicted phage head-tail adaptor
VIPREGRKTDSSEFRHRVSIQSEVKTADGEGGFTYAWATLSTVWAAVNPLKAAQQFDFRSVGVDATHLIKVRGTVQLQEKNRILFNGRTFEVLTAEDLQERGIVKLITCKEVR